MTQKEVEKAKMILGMIMPPVGVETKNTLSKDKKETLYKIVITGESYVFKGTRKRKEEERKKAYESYVVNANSRIEEFIRQVVEILQNRNYGVCREKKLRKNAEGEVILDSANNPTYATTHQDIIPILIKQVLFYLACDYISVNNSHDKKNQNDFLELVKRCGINLSHNFFTKLNYAPYYCTDMLVYKQPENPIRYKGQKKGELAVAIKHLVYQAGTEIQHYVDIFGGSASATTAVCDSKIGLKFTYNELSTSVFNVIDVLSKKELKKEFIRQLELLVEDLDTGKPFIMDINYNRYTTFVGDDNRYNIDGYYDVAPIYNAVYFNDEIEQYLSRNPESLGQRRIIEEFSNEAFFTRDYVENKIMYEYEQNVKEQEGDFVFQVGVKKYKKHELLKYCGWDGFIKSAIGDGVVEKYIESMLLGNNWLDVEVNGVRAFYATAKIKRKQYRFYCYYVYFSNLLYDANQTGILPSGEKVLYALAEYFIQYMAMYGDGDPSRIYRMNYYGVGYEEYGVDVKPYQFIRDVKCEVQIVNNFHDCVRKITMLNKPFDIVINQYKNTANDLRAKSKENKEGSRVLFYSDSPYLETSDYDKSNGVPAFTIADMKNLIEALVIGKDKFIFSCRAAKSLDNEENGRAKLKISNRIIFKYVFLRFLQYIGNESTRQDLEQILDGERQENVTSNEEIFWNDKWLKGKEKELYVLAIEWEKEDENGAIIDGSLANLLETNDISEIMITNYPISSISDVIRVWSYKDGRVIDILRGNILCCRHEDDQLIDILESDIKVIINQLGAFESLVGRIVSTFSEEKCPVYSETGE